LGERVTFWKKLREFFVGPDVADVPRPSGPSFGTPFEKTVWDACFVRIQAGQQFTGVDIADAATAGQPRTVETITTATKVVHALFDRGLFGPHGYTRTMLATPAGSNWVYHPAAIQPNASPIVAAATVAAAQKRTPTGPLPAKKGPASAKDPYDIGVFLQLTPEEHRARSLKINPYQTAWIGRTDVIPPESDERTALIDRGLELRGFLSREEIVEIHRIGDLWLKHKHAASLAESIAKKNVEEAIAQRRIAKQLAKEEKKRLAAEKATKAAENKAKRKANDIIFLGRDVSSRLADRRSHVENLAKAGLPIWATPSDVAKALGLTCSELRFLAFHSEAQTVAHYTQFEVPKRSGGKRVLSAPKPDMAKAQEFILHEVLEKLPTEAPAHGFIKGRSTVTNAQQHQGQAVVMNQDLSDFFPTITFPRVRGLFCRMGYSPAVATILALLTTECPRVRATYQGKTYFVATGLRALPQGACTSPALSNQIAKKLDRRLAGYAEKHAFTYTRYADDLTFSAGKDGDEGLPKLLATMHHITRDEGFAIHPEKGRVQRSAKRQTVTGIVVNERDRLSIPREELRELRAILHNAKKTGLAAQNRDNKPDFEAYVRGKIAYVSMVDKARGEKLLEAFRALEAPKR
jgi:hypothetical protein